MIDYSQDLQTGNGEVRIGDHYFPVDGDSVSELNLARYQNKVTFGDPSLDSDPLVSSQVNSSFTGGMGNEILKEGAEDDTFWDSDLETRYPEGPTLLPLTEDFVGTGEASAAFPLGDFPAADPRFYAAFDSAIHVWNAIAQEFEAVDDLPANPAYKGVEFDGLFYIPLGADGYATLDTSDVITPLTDFTPIQFIVWDKKLCALTTDGYLRIMPRGGTWSAESEEYRLPDGNKPRRLVNFINQNGTPALHVVTNSLVFAWDADGTTLYETRLDYPKHPDQGRGAVNWRGDTMYVSVGVGIHGYNGTNITTMGPDGRFGLPASLRGTIVDLAAEYNSLLAMVKGLGEVVEDDGMGLRMPPAYGDDTTYAITDMPTVNVKSSILRWSNSQWHKLWEPASAIGNPTWMEVSNTDTEYRLWWGCGSRMFTQVLPVAYQNPKQSLLAGATRFTRTGKLISGWFDADMTAFMKLSSHIEVNMEDVTGFNEPGGKITVHYQIDSSQSWVRVGEASTVGLTIMPFNLMARIVGNPFSQGRPFRRFRYMVTYDQKVIPPVDPLDPESVAAAAYASSLLSPLMSSLVFKFHKIPESQLSWSFGIPLTSEGGYKGMDNYTLGQYLNALLVSDSFFEFAINDRVYRVRMAQTQNGIKTGYDRRGNYMVNLVEAKLGAATRDPSTVVSYVDYGTVS